MKSVKLPKNTPAPIQRIRTDKYTGFLLYLNGPSTTSVEGV